MGEKDIAEKVLEDYNDVFADIVNVLLFQGEQIVKPEQLEDKTLRSSYKADGKLREIVRDVGIGIRTPYASPVWGLKIRQILMRICH